ncbi:MAG: DUF4333 domain-containing protein [Solirubrobacterales bacterium]
MFAFATVALVASGCGKTVVDQAKLEDTIRASLEQSLERERKITAVDCPSGQEVEPEATFTCSVRFSNGDKATATMEIRNTDADVSLVGLKANE